MTKLPVRLLAILCLAATPALAQEGDGRRAPRPIKAEMEKLDEAIDAVSEYIEKFEGKAPTAQLDIAVKSLQEAKQHTPRTAAEQPEDKRAAFVAAYRVEINKAIRGLLDLEDAVLAKDGAKAKAALDALGALKKTSHRTYKGRRRRAGR